MTCPSAGIRDYVDCDVAVVADDIHVDTRGIDWAARTFERPLRYLLGNHECYGHDYTTLVHAARETAASYPNVLLLDNARSPSRTFGFWARHCSRAWNPRITP